MSDALLEISNVSKSFGAVQASKDVSLDLRRGEIHALIGPNGAGKSTLIGLTAGTIPPDAGHIMLGGEDVTGLDAVGRARAGLGRTFQISALAMEHTVLQNAVLGAIGKSGGAIRMFGGAIGKSGGAIGEQTYRTPAMAALERVGLADQARRKTAELSHGERRQLEVAVALTLEPKVFLMDEPMAGLGAEGTKRMTGFLDTLRHQSPILLVEHDMDAVFALADRISVLVYGEIVATGTPDEIRRDARVREAYLGEEAL